MPPSPSATSGPKTGSWTTPAMSSLPCEHRLDDHGAADARAAARDRIAPRTSRTTPPVSVLCAPGTADLTTTGTPMRGRSPRCVVRRRRRSISASERDAVGLEQTPALGGVEPDVVGIDERGGDDGAGGRPVDAGERGTTPSGRRSQAARRAPTPSARAAASGEANVAMCRGDSRSQRISLDSSTATTGLCSPASLGDAASTARSTSAAVATTGRDEEHADGVECRIGEQRRQGRGERLGGRRSEEIDRVRETGLGRQHRPKAVAGRLRRLRQLQALGRAGVGEEDPESSGIRDDGDARAERQRLGREQNGGVEELRQRLRPQDAGLPEERVDGDVRARERRRVRSGGPCAGRGRCRP